MPDAQAPSSVWRVAPQRELHIRHFDHESVLFDAASGDTHLLSSDAGRLIDLLVSGPHTLAALCSAQPNTPALDSLLRNLAKIDLVRAE